MHGKGRGHREQGIVGATAACGDVPVGASCCGIRIRSGICLVPALMNARPLPEQVRSPRSAQLLAAVTRPAFDDFVPRTSRSIQSPLR